MYLGANIIFRIIIRMMKVLHIIIHNLDIFWFVRFLLLQVRIIYILFLSFKSVLSKYWFVESLVSFILSYSIYILFSTNILYFHNTIVFHIVILTTIKHRQKLKLIIFVASILLFQYFMLVSNNSTFIRIVYFWFYRASFLSLLKGF